jgi:hydrogenase maturation protease
MILVIGYGNPLRGDDGVGWAVAEAVTEARPDARVMTAQMLLPELAEDVARATGVVFIDARVGPTPGYLRCEPVRPSGLSAPPGHTLTASSLLDLALALYGHRPNAFLVSVEARDFPFRRGLSPAVSAAIPAALDTVLGVIDALSPSPSST